MKIRFDDSGYRFAWEGKAPRGYGLWVFSARTDDDTQELLLGAYAFRGTLTNAKKDVSRYLREQNNNQPSYLRVGRVVVKIAA